MIEPNEIAAALTAWTGVLWKASWQALALAALAGLALWAGRVRSPALRHAVWASTAALMLLTPWMSLPQRARGIEVPMSDTIYLVVTAGVAPSAAAQPETALPWRVGAAALWLAGLAFFGLRRMAGAWWLRETIQTARLLPPLESGVRWLESARVRAPVATGLLRPTVLLPSCWKEWSAEKRQAVVVHETAHIRRGDPWFQTLTAWNRAVFWFHPAAWWLEVQIAAEAELACDDEAAQQLGDARAYAQALVEIAAGATGGRLAPGAAMAGAAPVTRRVDRLLGEATSSRGFLARRQVGRRVRSGGRGVLRHAAGAPDTGAVRPNGDPGCCHRSARPPNHRRPGVVAEGELR